MKFQCQKFRGKQSEWFGKRGLSWHVSSVVLKQAEEPMVVTYTHMFDTCTRGLSNTPTNSVSIVLYYIHITID